MKRFFSSPVLPLVAGACLRLLFVFKYPAATGDTVLYEQFAGNWLKLGKFAMDINGQATPVDLRMPGYPAFLALVYALTGRTGEAARVPVMLRRFLVDLATCVVIAALATMLVRLCGRRQRQKECFCSPCGWQPYVHHGKPWAVPLTEVCAVFLTAAAFLLLAAVAARVTGRPVQLPGGHGNERAKHVETGRANGFVVGVGALFRPETPLVLITTFVALAFWMLPRQELKRWLLLCFVMCVGCAFARSCHGRSAMQLRLHEFQPLTPKDTTLPSEVDPKGFMAWEKTWLYRVRDNYLVAWKLNDDEIHMEDIPDSAFDTPEERERVATILDKYNDEITWTPEGDAIFAQLARERTARHPLRTYLWIPARRPASACGLLRASNCCPSPATSSPWPTSARKIRLTRK